ncbi:MAG: twin-arginine translocase TatA/TatE family subunit [Actinomycetota bacterium]|jgi:sec-independent protein translocase protein TatA|nr:twin-arginine translocase TatA/TatE family subunit [Actinomycetota bacterium]
MLAEVIGTDALIVLLVIVVIFGASRLPKMARSLGQAKSEFEKGIKESDPQNTDTKNQ